MGLRGYCYWMGFGGCGGLVGGKSDDVTGEPGWLPGNGTVGGDETTAPGIVVVGPAVGEGPTPGCGGV